MKNKIIILDFDDTLIDTDKIRNQIVKLAEGLGVSKKDALSARGKVRSSSKPFTIENYAQFLFVKEPSKQKLIVESFEKMFGKKGEFNYPGVEQFLFNLERKYKLILLTYGNLVLQQKKIKQSGLDKYFSEVIISPDHTKAKPLKGLLKKYGKNILFIDNSKNACKTATKMNVPKIWLTSNKKGPQYFASLSKQISKRIF